MTGHDGIDRGFCNSDLIADADAEELGLRMFAVRSINLQEFPNGKVWIIALPHPAMLYLGVFLYKYST